MSFDQGSPDPTPTRLRLMRDIKAPVHTYFKLVALTPAGEEWLQTYGGTE